MIYTFGDFQLDEEGYERCSYSCRSSAATAVRD
jgi:hypothetical protein